jgi:hypothetical protein
MKPKDPDSIPPTAMEFILSAVKKADGKPFHQHDLVDDFARVRNNWRAAQGDGKIHQTSKGSSGAISRALVKLRDEGRIQSAGLYLFSEVK